MGRIILFNFSLKIPNEGAILGEGEGVSLGGAFWVGPGSCGGCGFYGVRASLIGLFWAVSGLRCSAVGWRLCGLGHLWFPGLSLREFVEDRTISDLLLSCV